MKFAIHAASAKNVVIKTKIFKFTILIIFSNESKFTLQKKIILLRMKMFTIKYFDLENFRISRPSKVYVVIIFIRRYNNTRSVIE
jgi:hypothetical protein